MPSHLSSASHGPFAARQVKVVGRLASGQASVTPSHLSSTSHSPFAMRQVNVLGCLASATGQSLWTPSHLSSRSHRSNCCAAHDGGARDAAYARAAHSAAVAAVRVGHARRRCAHAAVTSVRTGIGARVRTGISASFQRFTVRRNVRLGGAPGPVGGGATENRHAQHRDCDCAHKESPEHSYDLRRLSAFRSTTSGADQKGHGETGIRARWHRLQGSSLERGA